MDLAITTFAAWVYLPFVLPICLYSAFTDLREMKITNQAVLALGGLFLVLGLIALPFTVYLWALATMVVVVVVGIVLNAAGAMGAGDAKFLAAAAPYIAWDDGRTILMIFTATLLAAVVTQRIAKYTPIRRAVPHWVSWERGNDFPMGLALGGALGFYIILGTIYGA